MGNSLLSKLKYFFSFGLIQSFYIEKPDQIHQNLDHRDQFIFRMVNKEDFLDNSFLWNGDKRLKFLDRLKNNHFCFGSFDHDNKLLSYLWYSASKISSYKVPFEEKLCLTLNENESYIWDCRTSIAFQNRGYYKEGLKGVVYQGFLSGIKRIWIVSDKFNKSSIRGITNVGFSKGKLIFLIRFHKMIFVFNGTLKILKVGDCLSMQK